MVAADLFKATKITGTDIDELAIETAEKNLLLNNVDPAKFSLMKGNLSETINEKYDVVAANMIRAIRVNLINISIIFQLSLLNNFNSYWTQQS